MYRYICNTSSFLAAKSGSEWRVFNGFSMLQWDVSSVYVAGCRRGGEGSRVDTAMQCSTLVYGISVIYVCNVQPFSGGNEASLRVSHAALGCFFGVVGCLGGGARVDAAGRCSLTIG